MAPSTKLKVIEQCRVRPSPSSSPPIASLPLTFFDIVFLRFSPVQRLFFYEYGHPIARFLGSDLPALKHSLAIALRRFYPLAGTLLDDETEREKPEICCSHKDSVSLTVALSRADFDELSGNHPRAVADFHPLVPPLLRKAVFAVQVTVFPSVGISVGTSLHHAVADGSTYTHFMKTWASLCCGGTANFVVGALPLFDRAAVRDPAGLGTAYMEDLKALRKDGDRSLEAWDLHGRPNVVMATFVFGREKLAELGTRTTTTTTTTTTRGCSPYALACGLVWSCLVIARGDRSRRTERFGFVTGCRPRVDPPLPAAYFGNCLGICRVEAKRKDLVGEDGGAVAAEAIWRVIGGLGEGGAFAGAEGWIRDVFGYASAKAVTVAGSPKLGIYEVDFGWGRPRKVEVVSIERTGALSLAECRDEPGGIEVGLALPQDEMEVFVSVFTDRFE